MKTYDGLGVVVVVVLLTVVVVDVDGVVDVLVVLLSPSSSSLFNVTPIDSRSGSFWSSSDSEISMMSIGQKVYSSLSHLIQLFSG